MNKKKKVAILMFSESTREARVMRQAMAMRGHYDVSVLGMGRNPFEGDPTVRFIPLSSEKRSLPAKLLRRAALFATVLGKVYPAGDTFGHRLRPCWQQALAWLTENPQQVLIAHDPETAALAALVKSRHGTKVILDLHEYSPRQSDNELLFRLVKGPHAVRTLQRWGSLADAVLTVNEHFCDLYVESCGIPRPLALHNCPERLPQPRPAKIDDGRIHLIHHGMCSPARELHLSIEALKTVPENVVLHFMFASCNAGYLTRLQSMAEEIPGRVYFDEPVDYTGILPAIAKYHAGLYFIPNNTFNHAHALANKFFDFLCAGLPLITGPNVSTAKYTRENSFGWVTEDFSASALSKVLSQLTPDSISKAAERADDFANHFNANTEHEKLLRLIENLMD